MAKKPQEGAGWKAGFWGPWLAAATSIQSFHVMACTPSPMAVAVGIWYGSLHAFGAIAKPVPWAPSMGEGARGGSHGQGRKGGRNPGERKPVKKFRPVWNLPAESEFEIEGALKMALFDLGKVALEVGYIIFLADVWRDSYLIGTSAAYRYSGCTNPLGAGAQGHCAGWVMVPNERGAIPWYPDFDPHGIINTVWITSPAGTLLSMGYAMSVASFYAYPNEPYSLSTWLRDDTHSIDVYGFFRKNTRKASGEFHNFAAQGIIPASPVDLVLEVSYYCEYGHPEAKGSRVWAADAAAFEGALIFDP